MTKTADMRGKLFAKESSVIDRTESVLTEGADIDVATLLREYRDLGKQYKSLLRDVVKLTKLSDMNQRKLMKANDTIAKKTTELEEKNEVLYRVSVTDHLTQVYNRTYLMDTFAKVFSAARRQKSPLCCVIMDIDKFKNFNDTYGHLTGDYVLKQTATFIAGSVRAEDIFGRYGGEEFLLILPHTDLDKGMALAEKIRANVEESVYRFEGEDLSVTMSFGVADLTTGSPANVDGMIKNADLALYVSKENGRNRVTAYTPDMD